MADKRYYWLKLKRDFFKRHDIQIIEDMPNGKEYILFYLKLLCESVDHDGNLRFSEQIPYNESMLATITRTNIDIVRAAIKVFTELNMMEVLDDGTLFMNEVHKMLGSETEWAEKKRNYRLAQQGQCQDNVPLLSDKSKSKSIELEKEIDISIKPKKKTTFTPPTREEVRDYAKEKESLVDPDLFYDYFNEGNWIDSEGKPVKSWKQKFITWDKAEKSRQKDKGAKNVSGNDRESAESRWHLEYN